jgi:hypothetical protein
MQAISSVIAEAPDPDDEIASRANPARNGRHVTLQGGYAWVG